MAVNTMVKHALAGSAYKDRVAECAAAVEGLKPALPGITSLRDVSPAQFEKAAHLLQPVPMRRARHVVMEDARVERFVAAGEAGMATAMGALMVASHRSLQQDYEVSCEELDFLVARALRIEGVYGSRMTGGGFGGCTVTMMRKEAVTGFRVHIAEGYEQRFGAAPQIYDCVPSAGAGEITDTGAL